MSHIVDFRSDIVDLRHISSILRKNGPNLVKNLRNVSHFVSLALHF